MDETGHHGWSFTHWKEKRDKRFVMVRTEQLMDHQNQEIGSEKYDKVKNWMKIKRLRVGK